MSWTTEHMDCDLLVVGGGIAGLVAAVQAAESGMRVLLATKGKIAGGASYFPKKASLGIQVTKGAADYAIFKEEIERVACGMNEPRIVDAYLQDSPHKIGLLDKIGFRPWLRGDNRPACFAQYPRDIYMIGGWPEAARNARALVEGHERITPLERAGLVRILGDGERVSGAVFARDGRYLLVRCKAIVLATGGVASLYRHNLYPNHIYGGGHAAALDAGCSLVNMEYVQFIPGLLAPKYKVLFGEHTLRFCTGMHDGCGRNLFADLPESEAAGMFTQRSAYAPFSFDYASRVFDTRMMDAIRAGSDGVRLSFSPALYEERSAFYAVYLDWLREEMGIDMCRDEVRVAPFGHSCNGGILIDEHGETALRGLFAVGEVASAIEGANRLGGNSVGGSLVFADRAVAKAQQYARAHERSPSFDALAAEFGAWCSRFHAESALTAGEVFDAIREILSMDASVVREHGALTAALTRLEALQAGYSPLAQGFDAWQALTMARVLVLAMLGRTESRGAHYRADFPHTDTRIYRQIVSSTSTGIAITRTYA